MNRDAIVRARVVQSTVTPGAVSLRTQEDEHGSASPFKWVLTEAGFEPGQEVVIVDAEKWRLVNEAMWEFRDMVERAQGGDR